MFALEDADGGLKATSSEGLQRKSNATTIYTYHEMLGIRIWSRWVVLVQALRLRSDPPCRCVTRCDPSYLLRVCYKVNPKYISVNWEASGGGAFAVIPIEERGKVPDQIPLFRGHTSAVLDTDWCIVVVVATRKAH